jgi:hypothetical protein
MASSEGPTCEDGGGGGVDGGKPFVAKQVVIGPDGFTDTGGVAYDRSETNI